tara:strand:+ start:144 stop:308 length:165 start_codon:yes stop_codon:yes gene_type:complete
MKLLVTNCNLNDAIGIWEVDYESQLCNKINDTLGEKVTFIKYTPNRPHSLTSFL